MKYECDKSGSTRYKGKYIQYEKGKNDKPKGSLDHIGHCRMLSKQQTTDMQASDVEQREYPIHTGAGWYELSNGETVRGKEEAEKAEANL